ncbi:hypothetical protein LINGRAHAP2_LOCUS4472, partial [Linum grandiflorum]
LPHHHLGKQGCLQGEEILPLLLPLFQTPHLNQNLLELPSPDLVEMRVP